MTGEGDASDTVSGIISSGVTVASGLFLQKETFEIGLKLGNIPNDSTKLQKKSDNSWVDVSEDEDLLQIENDLRIITMDNTTWNLITNRGTYYRNNRSRLNNILNQSVPLKIEVRRYVGTNQQPLKRSAGIRCAIVLNDIEEDLEQIQGIREKSGRELISEFNHKIKGDTPQDNCSQSLAPQVFEGKCREPVKGGKPLSSKIFSFVNGDAISPLHSDGSQRHMVVVDRWDEEGEGDNGFISATVKFAPPPVLGDNYVIKLSLVGDFPYIYKQAGKDTNESPQTSPITIWRRVKVQMFIQGETEADASLYDEIDWGSVKKAYNDAYIEVEYPTISAAKRTDNSQAVYYIISPERWIAFLDRFVYSHWKHQDWLRLKNNHDDDLRKFLSQYSFPQTILAAHPPAGGGVPLSINLVPSDSANPTSWDLLGRLTIEISKKLLSESRASNFESTDLGNCASTASLTILLCRPPSPTSGVGGMFMGGKRFFVVASGDTTGIFVHEMGHALFLEHGATKFHDAFDVYMRNSFSIAVESVASGSNGPKWDLHDSEALYSCIMSYKNHFKDAPSYWYCKSWSCDDCFTWNDGSSLTCSKCNKARGSEQECNARNISTNATCDICLMPKGGGVTRSYEVDWHFCGGCLLLLRFYDGNRLIQNDALKNLQFALRKGWDMTIAYTDISEMSSGNVHDLSIINAIISSKLRMSVGERTHLLVLYPEEERKLVGTGNVTGLSNNRGCAHQLDVSRHTRGRWIFVDANNNEVPASQRVIRLQKRVCDDGSVLTRAVAVKRGINIIKFGIEKGENDITWSREIKVEVI